MTKKEWLKKYKGKKIKLPHMGGWEYFIPEKFSTKYDHIIEGINQKDRLNSWNWEDPHWELHPDETKSPHISATQTPQIPLEPFKGTAAEFMSQYRGKKMVARRLDGTIRFEDTDYLVPTEKSNYNSSQIRCNNSVGRDAYTANYGQYHWTEIEAEKGCDSWGIARALDLSNIKGEAKVGPKCTCIHSFLAKGCTCGAIATYKMRFS